MEGEYIPILIPEIENVDINLAVEVIKSGMLVQGEYVEKLEEKVSGYCNVKYAVAVSSGTAALHLALIVLGIKEGDEVIVPAFSFPATANVVELVGAKPVFIDIDIRTFNIDFKQIEHKITPKTRAIMPVHEFGLTCDINEIITIAKKYNLLVIEDAACALGALENGQHAGTFGDIGTFSLHPRKTVTSGEGGVIITDNEHLFQQLKIYRNHGISVNEGKTDFIKAGYNYRLTEFQAALAFYQIDRLDDTIKMRDRLVKIYYDKLRNNLNLNLPFYPNQKRHSWQTFHILLDREKDRSQIIKDLYNRKIGSNYGAYCIPSLTFYKEKYSFDCVSLFPNALKAYNQGLVLPLYKKLSPESVSYISKIVNELI